MKEDAKWEMAEEIFTEQVTRIKTDIPSEDQETIDQCNQLLIFFRDLKPSFEELIEFDYQSF